MRRFYRLLISTLVIVGIIAVATAETPVDQTEKTVCLAIADCSDGEQIASADVKKKKKKKKKKKGKKGGKGKKKKKGFFKKAFGDK